MKYQVTRVVITDLPNKGGESFANIAKRNEVQSALNHNSIMFNVTDRHESNLIDYSKRYNLYKKTSIERVELKKCKKEYKQSCN